MRNKRKPDGRGVMEAMGKERREESILLATIEVANEIRTRAVIEFGCYTMGLKFVT